MSTTANARTFPLSKTLARLSKISKPCVPGAPQQSSREHLGNCERQRKATFINHALRNVQHHGWASDGLCCEGEAPAIYGDADHVIIAVVTYQMPTPCLSIWSILSLIPEYLPVSITYLTWLVTLPAIPGYLIERPVPSHIAIFRRLQRHPCQSDLEAFGRHTLSPIRNVPLAKAQGRNPLGYTRIPQCPLCRSLPRR